MSIDELGLKLIDLLNRLASRPLASAASWITPKKYFEQVGPDGFKKKPVGLGPYKFVSTKPGIEIVMEANEDYWRTVPSAKRLVVFERPGGNDAARDAETRRS